MTHYPSIRNPNSAIRNRKNRRHFLRAIGLAGCGVLDCIIESRIAGASKKDNPQSAIRNPQSKQTYTFKVGDNCDIQADVHRMPGRGVLPAVLWIHGGALVMGHRGNINPEQLDHYMDAGYAVVSVDYRLAPEVKLRTIIEDIRDAYRWVREKGPGLFRVDPNRIAVVGHSAGGYLTLMTGFCVRPRPKALVSFYGYGDIAGTWYSRPDPFYSQQPTVSKDEAYRAVGGPVITGTQGPHNRGRFYLYCRQQGLWPKEVAGHDPDAEPKAFDPFCPVRNITPDYPPTLLLHGDKDTDVPYAQSVLMSERPLREGVRHELITISGGGHGFDRKLGDPVVAQAFSRVLAFLRQHLS